MYRSIRTSRAGRMLARSMALALLAGALVNPATSIAAEPTNMVLVWNENAVNVISQPAATPALAQGPPLAAAHLAMVHGAIYDAVNAIVGGYQPYLAGLSAPSTASQAAAVAQAGHDVLYGIAASSPAVRLRVDDMLAASLAMIDAGQAKTDGIAIGAAAATAMLLARSSDGRFDVEPFIPSNDVGKWRLVGPLNANVQGQFATVTPFTLKSPDQFMTEGLPPVTSDQYTAEFNEVKALGAQVGSSRTAAQTLMAGFYTANPLFFYNAGLRAIATQQGLSTSQQARLFVKTSMAGADALIDCWANKKVWNTWRPETAIRAAANDGNPDTAPDANWTALFAAPGYPDEPSGYNCYTGGFWHSVRFFFGTDKFNFSLTSPGVPANAAVPPGNPVGVPGSTRTFSRFSDVCRETIEGRILNGFHFRTADEHGAWIGKKAAQWGDHHFFQSNDGPGHDGRGHGND